MKKTLKVSFIISHDVKQEMLASREDRQQELMETLMARLSTEELMNIANTFSIDSSPPKSKSGRGSRGWTCRSC